jgi:hypothetical protein
MKLLNYNILEIWDFSRIMAVGSGIEILGIFEHQHEIFDRWNRRVENTIIPILEIFNFLWLPGHMINAINLAQRLKS